MAKEKKQNENQNAKGSRYSKKSAKVQNEKTRGIMRFCMIFANNGFIGIPLAKAVFGDGSAVMAYLIILNVINNVMLFTLGIFLVSGDKKTISVKKGLMNPVLISFLIGVALNLLGDGLRDAMDPRMKR